MEWSWFHSQPIQHVLFSFCLSSISFFTTMLCPFLASLSRSWISIIYSTAFIRNFFPILILICHTNRCNSIEKLSRDGQVLPKATSTISLSKYFRLGSRYALVWKRNVEITHVEIGWLWPVRSRNRWWRWRGVQLKSPSSFLVRSIYPPVPNEIQITWREWWAMARQTASI